MNITKCKPGHAIDNHTAEQASRPAWSRVALKSQLGQNGVPLPSSAQHRLWIQPSRCR